jgi:molybdopterin converting factor small subunit
MKIFVKSFASLITTGRITEKTMELPRATPAGEVLRLLGVGEDEEMIVLVNQRPSPHSTALADGDRVTLMPPVSAA